jgi:hypothetical protein
VKRAVEVGGWVLVALLVWLGWPSAERRVPGGSLAERLLGPVAELAADLQWVRTHDALRRGDVALAFARAESALALAPGATGGWLFLARYLAFDRASEEREVDPERRRAAVAAGLELARRGEACAREPAELALWQGLVRVKEAEEGDLAWPGGARVLLGDAVADFERAAELGHADGAELAAGTRRRLAALP